MKKFATEEEYQAAIHDIKWNSYINSESSFDTVERRINEAKHKTPSLNDALFLIKLAKQKIEEHNARCSQQVGKMKTIYYRRNNVATE